MSVFDRPTWMRFTRSEQRMKPEQVELEGKWYNLRRIVQDLTDDGWRQVTLEPNDEFTLTTVRLER